MSREARKCDRCGKLYENYTVTNKKLMPYNNGAGYKMNAVMAIKLNDSGNYYEGKEMDLCPGCMEEFVNFMGCKEETKKVSGQQDSIGSIEEAQDGKGNTI